MTVYGMDVKGLGGLMSGLTGLAAAVDKVAKANVEQLAASVEREAKANFDGTTKRGPHVPSATDPVTGHQYPNIRTGTLRRSIHAQPVERLGNGAYRTVVGPTTKYGRRVEMGLAPTGAYPFFGPGVRRARDKAADILRGNIARYLT